MTTEGINISKAIEDVQGFLDTEKIPFAFKAAVLLLIAVTETLVKKLGLNSSNSSKPPSSDPNREKKGGKGKSGRKPGGQNGRKGTRLEPIENPDKIVKIPLDQEKIPKGKYTEGEPIKRQVFDIIIKKYVTEYQAQVLVKEDGTTFSAEFPEGINNPTQYGPQTKAKVVYDSQVQLIPVERIIKDFAENYGMPISHGSVINFNSKAYCLLEDFERACKLALKSSPTLNVDETGINIGGKRWWLHSASNNEWTFMAPHKKRGREAMEDIAIIPGYKGVLCHDHWKAYFYFTVCLHALCNAHHLRELKRAYEQDGCEWAKKLIDLLLEILEEKLNGGEPPPLDRQKSYRKSYRKILEAGGVETPPPPPKLPGKRGRLKKSKARNLLERLQEYEEETLLFMTREDVEFSNNLAERDIRMVKVHQKISGCFRSEEGAKRFTRIRSFISTCRKQGVSSAQALNDLFTHGKLPCFVSNVLHPPE